MKFNPFGAWVYHIAFGICASMLFLMVGAALAMFIFWLVVR
jgi:hypothetical protein